MTQTEWPEHEVAQVRIELAHGIVQLLCNSRGVDALHIKGLALSSTLRHAGRVSMDVDLLVRPPHINALRTALNEHGWQQTGRFATGSPFEHAENWHHETLGHLDLHRLIPGVGLSPDEAFDAFWRSRNHVPIAQIDCAVPSVDTQALIVLLHAARAHGDQRSHLDVEHVWRSADLAAQQRLRNLVAAMHAEVAFAAATGGLENFRHRPDYLLWKVNSSPDAARTTEWRARIKASPDVRSKASVAFRSVLVNRDHLRVLSGHEPSRTDMLREFIRRVSMAAREVTSRRTRR